MMPRIYSLCKRNITGVKSPGAGGGFPCRREMTGNGRRPVAEEKNREGKKNPGGGLPYAGPGLGATWHPLGARETRVPMGTLRLVRVPIGDLAPCAGPEVGPWASRTGPYAGPFPLPSPFFFLRPSRLTIVHAPRLLRGGLKQTKQKTKNTKKIPNAPTNSGLPNCPCK